MSIHMVMAGLWSLDTTTSVVNLHRGSALPAARVVIVAVPATALLAFWWLTSRRRGER